MKIKHFLIPLLFISKFLFSQNQEIKTDISTIIPPSPTVASLMKFEEIPVSNYTGIPDISIPLFSSTTHTKDIDFNIYLKYHPSGIAADAVASDVGLGWSLFAGGTISRIIKDIPDEYYMLPIAGPFPESGKIGIYQNLQKFHRNDFYKLLEEAKDNYSVNVTQEEKNKFLWENFNKGKYDSDHDIWQYQFMGYSGRFIIQKNILTNILEVKNLSLDNNLLIKNSYNNSSFIPESFEVFDSKGYKYIFDIKEFTTLNIFTDINYYGSTYSGSSDYYISRPLRYISSIHLSKIFDRNNKLLVSISYNPDNELIYESNQTYSYEYNMSLEYNTPESVLNFISYNDFENVNMQNQKLEPKSIFVTNKTITECKKIKNIIIEGISKFELEYDNERLDFSETDKISKKIKSISQMTANNQIVSKINLNYFYDNTNYRHTQKLFLQSVDKVETNGLKVEKTAFEYDFSCNLNQSVGKDYWGFHNSIKNFESVEFTRNATTQNSKIGILKKIIYPTKGSTTFEYEPNTYSFIGDLQQNNFEDNPTNFEEEVVTVNFTIQDQQKRLFNISDNQNISIMYDLGGIQVSDYRFNIYKQSGDNFYFYKSIESSECLQQYCEINTFMEAGNYNISLSSIDRNFPRFFNLNTTFNYKSRSANQSKFLIGGGNRIKKIKYFTDKIDQNLSKELLYDYSLEINSQLSSGSLAFGKPQFEYIKNKSIEVVFPCGNYNSGNCSYLFDVTYKTIGNNHQSINFKTLGADVGYKNVTIKENGRGKIKYTYSSPIDYPEASEAYNMTYPFYASENIDYKRGLLSSEESFDESRILAKTTYGYEFVLPDEKSKILGFKTYLSGNNCPYDYRSKDYDTFKSLSLSPNSFYGCVEPIFNYNLSILKTAYGWSKLATKNTTKYFYPDGGSIPTMSQTAETYTYNSLNKKISESTITNSNGEILKTKYLYHSGNSIYSQNRIADIESIETYKGSSLLSKSKINYANAWSNNLSLLPQSVATLKANQSLENRLIYNAYDEFSNPLEVQQESGMLIAYIWGYNKTQPIAKIENATYAQIQQYEANLQTLSNGTDEASLIIALNALRTNLPNAMVTTYTHKPLIGVSTATDPKGDQITYSYDSFNRLKFVKDKSGNILSENLYNFKP